jgi:hypothetical protein
MKKKKIKKRFKEFKGAIKILAKEQKNTKKSIDGNYEKMMEINDTINAMLEIHIKENKKKKLYSRNFTEQKNNISRLNRSNSEQFRLMQQFEKNRQDMQKSIQDMQKSILLLCLPLQEIEKKIEKITEKAINKKIEELIQEQVLYTPTSDNITQKRLGKNMKNGMIRRSSSSSDSDSSEDDGKKVEKNYTDLGKIMKNGMIRRSSSSSDSD